MAGNSDLDPSSFLLRGEPAGVLLIHGFTSSPTEFRLIGEYLNGRGFTVSVPLLPGHGTTADDLNTYGWHDWFDHAKRCMKELQEICNVVFVGGISMGALIALSLAASGAEVQGVISYAAALEVKDKRRILAPIVTRFVRQLPKSKRYWADPKAESLKWCYDTYPVNAAVSMLNQIPKIKNQLTDVNCPLIAFYSRRDTRVKQSGIYAIFDNVSSSEKELVEVHDCGHEMTLDSSWEVVAEKTYHFMLQYGGREGLMA